MAHAIPDQNPGHTLNPKAFNQRRMLLIVLGGAAALALFVARRNAAAAAPADPAAADQPSTFADNGGQAAQLGNDVTGALGDVSSTLSGLTDAIGTLAQNQADLPGQLAAIGATGTAETADPAAPVADSGVMLAPNVTGDGTAGSPAGKMQAPTFVKRSPSTGKLTEYRLGASGRPIPMGLVSQPHVTTVRPVRQLTASPGRYGKPAAPAAAPRKGFVKRSASTGQLTYYRVGASGRPIPQHVVRTGSAAGKKRR